MNNIGRIKKVLKCRRPDFWLVAAAVLVIIAAGSILVSKAPFDEGDFSF